MRTSKRVKALEKERTALRRQEARMAAAAARPRGWKEALEGKLPPRVRTGLESAFCKGFSLIFRRGRGIIEKGFDREAARTDHLLRDYAVQLKGGRRELKALARQARRSDLRGLTVTTAEGIALGALGIGMPDVALFLGNLLGAIYETALRYGFDYDSPWEQVLILEMMAAALSPEPQWSAGNRRVDTMFTARPREISDEEFREQIRRTADVFATELLLLKFLQGVPLVGILGGAANPMYYRKVMNYVQLKYRQRYLMKQSKEEPPC